jgi:hypothetical protein
MRLKKPDITDMRERWFRACIKIDLEEEGKG